MGLPKGEMQVKIFLISALPPQCRGKAPEDHTRSPYQSNQMAELGNVILPESELEAIQAGIFLFGTPRCLWRGAWSCVR